MPDVFIGVAKTYLRQVSPTTFSQHPQGTTVAAHPGLSGNARVLQSGTRVQRQGISASWLDCVKSALLQKGCALRCTDACTCWLCDRSLEIRQGHTTFHPFVAANTLLASRSFRQRPPPCSSRLPTRKARRQGRCLCPSHSRQRARRCVPRQGMCGAGWMGHHNNHSGGGEGGGKEPAFLQQACTQGVGAYHSSPFAWSGMTCLLRRRLIH